MTTIDTRAVEPGPRGESPFRLGLGDEWRRIKPEPTEVSPRDLWEQALMESSGLLFAYRPHGFNNEWAHRSIRNMFVHRGGANVYPFGAAFGSASDETDLRNRLDNVNAYYRRKAADVVMDKSAVRLLAKLYQSTTIEFPDLDTCNDGIALAKLAAARFCEIGTRAVQITETGTEFIESIRKE